MWLAKLFYSVLHKFAHSYYVAVARELERLNCCFLGMARKACVGSVMARG